MVTIPIRPLEKIRDALASMPETQSEDVSFAAGEILMREGEKYDWIALLIQGEIELLKQAQDGGEYPVGTLRPGQFLGVLMLSSGATSFLTSRARTAGRMLRMPRDTFLLLLYNLPGFNQMVGPLLLGNLVSRYRRVVELHVQVAELTRDLAAEKRQLQATIAELEATRNQLIQQEKMATLGQLVAGIAHEINNPVASLSRAADSIEPGLRNWLAWPPSPPDTGLLAKALEEGINRQPLQTEIQRQRLAELAIRFPDLPRPLLRTLAQVEPAVFEDLVFYVVSHPTVERKDLVHRWVQVFEVGTLVRTIRLAAARISGIVRSLKGYSRQDKALVDEVDLREGLRDTLVLLGYALKKYEVQVDLREIPRVRCRPSELNQVWTNLITNACQAMGESGVLRVACGPGEPGWVWVRIQDSGPGVPLELREQIFESGFSTKRAAAPEAPGLGLGLAIARGIVEQHRGRIEVTDAPEGGAVFTVFLPVAGQ
ncbi:MAG: cyclic nucleotide-binding domain-containing protein [Verrucomicrobia bacterium]|nr:cyclic nucleotide-binding domain-containing protein [Verrucomicrobiota bacterium]